MAICWIWLFKMASFFRSIVLRTPETRRFNSLWSLEMPGAGTAFNEYRTFGGLDRFFKGRWVKSLSNNSFGITLLNCPPLRSGWILSGFVLRIPSLIYGGLSQDERPYANNKNVLVEYSSSMQDCWNQKNIILEHAHLNMWLGRNHFLQIITVLSPLMC